VAINGRAGAQPAHDHQKLYRRHGPLHCRVMSPPRRRVRFVAGEAET
jgi:hypothetical protein